MVSSHTAVVSDSENGKEWHWKSEIANDEGRVQLRKLYLTISESDKHIPKNPEQDNHAHGSFKVDPPGRDSWENADGEDPSSTTDLYNTLINDGRFVPGDEDDLVPLEEIPWIDKSLIKESVNFHRKFFALVLLANTSALMFGFAIKPNAAVLLRTGKLHDPERSFHRYLSTIHRISKFFAFQFNMKEAFQAFQTVRKMHALASRKNINSHPTPKDLKLHEPWKTELALAIRKDLEHIDTSSAPSQALTWDPPLPVSQFDMAITQFGFWGSMWLFPRVFGIQDRNREMRGVIHTWAIFGRLLGIKDEYNICLKPDPKLYDKLFRNVIVESLKTVDETVITLQSAFMEAFSKRAPFVTYKSLLFTGFQEWDGFKGDNLWELMSWRDKVSLKFMVAMLWMMRNSGVIRVLVNLIFAIWLQVQFWLHMPNFKWPSSEYVYSKMY